MYVPSYICITLSSYSYDVVFGTICTQYTPRLTLWCLILESLCIRRAVNRRLNILGTRKLCSHRIIHILPFFFTVEGSLGACMRRGKQTNLKRIVEIRLLQIVSFSISFLLCPSLSYLFILKDMLAVLIGPLQATAENKSNVRFISPYILLTYHEARKIRACLYGRLMLGLSSFACLEEFLEIFILT